MPNIPEYYYTVIGRILGHSLPKIQLERSSSMDELRERIKEDSFFPNWWGAAIIEQRFVVEDRASGSTCHPDEKRKVGTRLSPQTKSIC